MITSLIPSFNAGELSPLIHLRSDLEKYRSGCRTLSNMLITPYGGVRRRPGLEYIATARGKARVFRFQYSVSDAYVLVFTVNQIQFFRNGAEVSATTIGSWVTATVYSFGNYVEVDGVVYHCEIPHLSGMSFYLDLAGGKWVAQTIYQIPTPYNETQLADVQMCQINNVAYFTHPDLAPYKLTRTSNANWDLTIVTPDYPPMLEENVRKSRTLTLQYDREAGGASFDITASFNLFDAGHVGAYFEVKTERKLGEFDVSLDATMANDGQVTSALVVQGLWNFSTQGTWDGKFSIQRSTNGGSTWATIREFTSSSDGNFSANGEEKSRVLLRLKFNYVGAGSSHPKARLEAEGAFIVGIVKCLSVTSTTVATFSPITAIQSGPTSYWSEGAWSTYRGFPRTVTAHEQRIVYGGTAYRSQSLWASAVDDFENFKRGVEDDDAWNHSLAADQQDSIQWLISNKALLIGTSGSEWVMQSSKDDGIITPTNVRARRHSGHGSNYIASIMAGSAVLFIQRGGRKVREMTFSFEADGYVTADLTLLADHIAGSGGIIQTALQDQRDTVLWCVTHNGRLLGMTYERGQNIAGWARHKTGDSATDGFESVTVISRSGEEDEVWVSVRRVIDGETVRTIERFKPDQFREQETGDLSDLFFVDAGVKMTGEDLTELTGLDHLEGETVQVIADGAVLQDRAVVSGKITLTESPYVGDPATASTIIAGLKYESFLEPMALEVGMQYGTSVSRKKRIHEVAIYFNQTSGCKVASKIGGQYDPIPFRTADMDPEEAPPLFTGFITHLLDARHDPDASLVIKQDLPLPMTITAVVPKWNVYGDND